MTALEDHQFELLTSEDDGAGHRFGIGNAVSCLQDGFDPGVSEWLTQDQDNPSTGATMMGRDTLKGSAFTWQLFANMESEEDALQAIADLGRLWLNRGLSREPGAVSVLRYQLGGRTRRVYGRPRRWGNTINNQLLFGMAAITCDFPRVDPLFYDDEAEVDTLDLVAESEGGITFPVVFPAISTPSGSNEGEIFVGGEQPTWGIYRFTGPFTFAQLVTDNWTVDLDTTLLTDEDWIEIDTRPWSLSIRNQSGAWVPGVLSPRVRFRDMALEPGSQSMAFRADSSSNTATVSIKRYPAYATL